MGSLGIKDILLITHTVRKELREQQTFGFFQPSYETIKNNIMNRLPDQIWNSYDTTYVDVLEIIDETLQTMRV